MWFGLYSLTGLHLEFNLITTIDDRTFAKLPNLEKLNLDNNYLTTFNDNVFSLKRHGMIVQLWLGDNPMYCDCRMCWLKEAEEQGSIEFNYGFRYPDCDNRPGEFWETIQLDCDKNDPEQVSRGDWRSIPGRLETQGSVSVNGTVKCGEDLIGMLPTTSR